MEIIWLKLNLLVMKEVIIGNVYFDIYNQSFNLVKNRKSLEFYDMVFNF